MAIDEAMGAPAENEQDATPSGQSEIPDSLIDQGVRMVETGMDIERVTADDDSPHTDEELQQAVREELAERQETETSALRDDGEDQNTITDARGVDWQALWEEFGFNTPNSVGSMHKSKTKVEEAVRVTEQPIAGDANVILSQAVDLGILAETKHKFTLIGGGR